MRLLTGKIRGGFTLIELLVVIAIIALLLAIITPALNKVKQTAKLTICGNNQRQLTLGVNAYAIENDDKYPYAVSTKNTGDYSWPNMLNYSNSGTRVAEKCVGYYLSDYLPEVGVFMCPIAPQKTKNLYQQAYFDYMNDPYNSVFSSYNMYWGGYTMADIDFVGPVKQTSDNKLLVSDVLSFGPDGAGGEGRWYSSHGSREFKSRSTEDLWGNLMSAMYFVDLPMDEPPGDVAMNYALTDGSVDRYSIEETDEHAHGSERAFRVPARHTYR